MVRFYGNQPTLLVSFPLTCQRCNSWEFHGANGVDCCCFFWLKGNWGCATSHGVASDLWQGFHPTLYALPPRWSSLIQDAWGYLHSHWTRRLGWWLMVGFVWQCFLFFVLRKSCYFTICHMGNIFGKHSWVQDLTEKKSDPKNSRSGWKVSAHLW